MKGSSRAGRCLRRQAALHPRTYCRHSAGDLACPQSDWGITVAGQHRIRTGFADICAARRHRRAPYFYSSAFGGARRRPARCGGGGITAVAYSGDHISPATDSAPVGNDGSGLGTHAGILGSRQFQRPNSIVSDGTSSARTTVASRRMPAARPVAKIVMVVLRAGCERAERQIEDKRGTGHRSTGAGDAARDRLLGRPVDVIFLTAAGEDGYVVVHREPERECDRHQGDWPASRPVAVRARPA
jgi:hypothetical protein